MDGCVKANDLSAGIGLFAEMTQALIVMLGDVGTLAQAHARIASGRGTGQL